MNINYNECFEFLSALFAIGQEELIKKNMKARPLVQSDDRFELMIKKIKSKTPSDTLKDIKYFYSLQGIGYLIYNTIFRYENQNNTQQMSIKELITEIQKITYEQACSYLIASNYYQDFSKIDLKSAPNQLKDLLSVQKLPEADRQKNLLEFVTNSDQLQTLISSTVRFYMESYSCYEEEIREICTEGVNHYQSLYQSDPALFPSHYLGGNYELSDLDMVHISFFAQLGLHLYQSKWDKRMVLILGIRSCDLLMNSSTIHKLAYFHKILSDPKRLELIRLISKRPYYGQELAAALDLATSTTSYHINMLMDLELVETSRQQKKVYFRFNQRRYESYLSLFDSYIAD